MQAMSQCSACASRAAGGLLRNATDVSLLRTSQIVLKKRVVCSSLSRSESGVLLNARDPGALKLGRWNDMASLSFSHGVHALSPTDRDDSLSHDSLIRRAASMVTDGSCTLLSQTTLAHIHTLAEYSKAVHTLIVLQKRYLASLGKLTPAEEDSLQQVIIDQRAKVNDNLKECKRAESTWLDAVNLCNMVTEAAYNCGAEQASIAVRTNVQVSQSQVQEAQKISADAEKDLANFKVEEIQRMAYNASLENSEGHEIHEAYLRED